MEGVNDATIFLSYSELPEYIPMFLENGFENRSALLLLTDNDLKEIGVVKLGHRKMILSNLEHLKKMNFAAEHETVLPPAESQAPPPAPVSDALARALAPPPVACKAPESVPEVVPAPHLAQEGGPALNEPVEGEVHLPPLVPVPEAIPPAEVGPAAVLVPDVPLRAPDPDPVIPQRQSRSSFSTSKTFFDAYNSYQVSRLSREDRKVQIKNPLPEIASLFKASRHLDPAEQIESIVQYFAKQRALEVKTAKDTAKAATLTGAVIAATNSLIENSKAYYNGEVKATEAVTQVVADTAIGAFIGGVTSITSSAVGYALPVTGGNLFITSLFFDTATITAIRNWYHKLISGRECAVAISKSCVVYHASGMSAAAASAGVIFALSFTTPVGPFLWWFSTTVGGAVGATIGAKASKWLFEEATERICKWLHIKPKAVLADAYAFLGVNPEDPNSAIRRAYREKALLFHPDRGGENEMMVKLSFYMELIRFHREGKQHYEDQQLLLQGYTKFAAMDENRRVIILQGGGSFDFEPQQTLQEVFGPSVKLLDSKEEVRTQILPNCFKQGRTLIVLGTEYYIR